MRAANILHLGVKELWSLARDPVLLGLIAFGFTVSIYSYATAIPETLHRVPLAIVDEDRSPLSARIVAAFQRPYFLPPAEVKRAEMDARMDAGLDTFALDIPPDFQRDVLAGRSPAIQLNVDATRMSQAFNGSGYVRTIIDQEVQAFVQRYRAEARSAIDLDIRVRFNANLTMSWFRAVMKLADMITMLAIVLTGAALIRERERGTIEHLLVMPVTPFEIMTSKVWSMGLVVLAVSSASLFAVLGWLLSVPLQGSVPLFLGGVAVHLFAVTSISIFLGTFARSMAQFGLLIMLVLLPLQLLSGSVTPRESMPAWVQLVMLPTPNTHFVMLAQSILCRGAGLDAVWPQFLALAGIGAFFFGIAHARFRQTIGTMA